MSINYAAKTAKAVYYLGKSITAAYYNNSKVFPVSGATNIYDDTVTDYWSYIHYSTHQYRAATGNSNLTTFVSIKPNTKYKVEMFMNTRFRIATIANIPASGTALSNYVYHSLDTNGTTAIDATETLEITSGASDTLLILFYWTTTGSMAAADIRKTIKIYAA